MITKNTNLLNIVVMFRLKNIYIFNISITIKFNSCYLIFVREVHKRGDSFSVLSPFVLNNKDRLIGQLWTNQRIQLHQVRTNPKQVACDGCLNKHDLSNSSVRSFRYEPRNNESNNSPEPRHYDKGYCNRRQSHTG